MSQSPADQGYEQAGSYGDRLTAERYGARIAQLASRWVDGRPYTTPRISEEEFRKLSASAAAQAQGRI